MAGTFSQIYLQIVFAVSGRRNILTKGLKEEVFKYIAGIIRNKGQKPLIVGGESDHIHILVGLRPNCLISDLVRDIKNNSSKFINQHLGRLNKFSWQTGYGVFSYSHDQIENVYHYIENQEKHHQKKMFREEYIEMLEQNKVEYDIKYLVDGDEDNFTPSGF